VPHRLAGDIRVRVRGVAARVERLLAEPARAAGNRERHDHAVALFEVRHGAADFDDLAHRLVAEDVALLHRRHEPVEEVQVGAADAAGGDPDDRIAGVLDLGVGNGVDANVASAVPTQGFHRGSRRGKR
jgi:hypothetical protein